MVVVLVWVGSMGSFSRSLRCHGRSAQARLGGDPCHPVVCCDVFGLSTFVFGAGSATVIDGRSRWSDAD